MNRNATQSAFSNWLLSGTLVQIGTFEEVQRICGIDTYPNVLMVISIDRYPDLAAESPIQWKIDIGQKLINQIDQTIEVSYLWKWVDSIQITVSIGIGKKYNEPYLLHHSFEEARKSMSGRFFQGNKLIFHSGIKPVEKNTLKAPTEERVELLALVRIGDEVNQLKNYIEQVANACRLNEDVFKTEVVDLIMLISRVVVESGVDATLIMSKNAQISKSFTILFVMINL
ncbi:hypothetical protein CN692_12255 [Bacillus sp. AFS002410]|uniref:hypothetical protein n=1 Tax=Bacillus sp. AFS002410 TaxID=2033481 RepID=UPI000BF23EA9|nr:hypothetical protein [Bacillus sp. AFS002410]PEJ57598.1 hypothetical protein CN692_12255 [Bacillus sp. AFS002410]